MINLNNISPVEYDISVWRGYDFALPLAVQYQNEMTVGSDSVSSGTPMSHYLPSNLTQPNNKVIVYTPLNLSSYTYVEFEIYSASNKLVSGKHTKLFSSIAAAGYCGTQPYDGMDLLDFPEKLVGISGGFSAVKTPYAVGYDLRYLLLHLSHNVTKDFTFNEAKYCVTLYHYDDDYGTLLDAMKVLTGDILMIGE